MTAKQYLSRAYWLRKKIQAKQERLEELRARSEKCTQILTGMPGGGSIVSSVEKMAILISDLTMEIDLDELDLMVYERDAERVIRTIDDPTCFQVLTKRYLSYMTWSQIADNMHYSTSHVFRIHAKALRLVDMRLNESTFV